MYFWSQITIFLVIITVLPRSSNQVSLQEDLTITQKQKQILDEFRQLVSSRLPHDYMNKDIYLVRWLRARKFNIPAAEAMLMNNINWRKENKIDTILTEDWSDFERDFRADIQGCDLEGRPVISVPVGDWDVRSAVIAGKSIRIMRYFDKLFEEVTTYIRSSQEKGENITQYNFIFEMSRFNLVLQGCPLCVPVYVHFFQSYENNYPASVHNTILVNVPQLFVPLWEIIRPFLSESTRKSIALYGKDKSEWQPILLQDIHTSQLTKQFGGKRDEPFELEELRVEGGYFKCSNFDNS